MTYPVRFSTRADRELEGSADWWANHRSINQARRWYAGFSDAIASLSSNPERCPLARENDSFACEIRDMPYALGAHPTHRAVFTIRPSMVLVLSIRHVAQPDLTPDDLP
jgi:plasmid stabilization system protein ParE